MTPKLNRWERALFVIAFVNFGVFFVMAAYLGGDALNGKVVNGHYLLDNKGYYTEVSRRIFVYSEFHAISMFLTHALAIFGYLCAKRRSRRSAAN